MTPERWRQIYDLFRESLPLEGAAREALLASRCAGDLALRDEVERLLAQDQEAEQEDFLAPPELTAPEEVAVVQVSALHLRCPNCGCGIELVDLMAAQSVQCPTCQSTIPLQSPLTAPWTSRLGSNRLDRFELLEAVGTGGFGTVYRAYDPNLERIVAVKVLRNGNLAAPESLARFLEEARSPAALRHKAIVPVFDAGEFSGIPYIVREFIRGVTLADSLKLRRPGFDEAAGLAAELAEALQYAHENHVIHRDVKPQNIMIDEDGRPHLMDFGMARRDASEITITVEGQVLGTPAYMPPEQARGEGHTVDGRSDVYSLGVVLYQMLTGDVPFRGTTRMLLHQVLHDEPRPPRKLNERIPRDLETICLKAMAKEPSRRYDSARELADDLRRFLDRKPIKARPVGAAERTWRWCRRNPSLAAAVLATGASLLATSIVSVLYASQSRRMLTESNKHLAMVNLDLGRSACDRDDVGPGLHWFAHGLQAARAAGDPILSRVARENLAGWEREYPLLLGIYSHEGPVNDALFSPDGKTAVTASFDETARLWDVATGRQIGGPLKHDGEVVTAAFNPGGMLVATASLDGTARIWDVLSQRSLHVLHHPPRVEFVAFSADGKTLVTAGTDKAARLWNVASGQPKGKPLVQSLRVNEVAFSPDGRLVVTTSDDRTAKLWDAATGELRGEPLQHDQPVWRARFGPDGKTLLTASSNIDVRSGEARLWDLSTHRLLQTFRHADNIYAVAYSPDARTVATGSRDKTARLWDAAKGTPRGEPLKHDDVVWAVDFSSDGKTLLTGSWDRSAQLWDVATGRTIGPPLKHQGPIRSAVFDPSGSRLLTAAMDGSARLWQTPGERPAGQVLPRPGDVRVETSNPGLDLVMVGTAEGQAQVCTTAGQIKGTPLSHGGRLSAMALSPDGTRALIGSEEGRALLWSLASASSPGSQHSFGARVSAAGFSPDGKTALAVSEDGTGQLWNVAAGQPGGALIHHDRAIRAMAFLDDRTVATAGEDKAVRLWDAATGQPRGGPLTHPDHVIALAASPDGRSLLTGCLDGEARIWDAFKGTERARPVRHQGPVIALAFSPDGRTAATGGDGGTSLLWNVATGERRGEPMVASGLVVSIAFSPDGKRIVTGGFDQTARLWDADSGKPLGPPLRHPGRVRSVRFTADGQSVLTGCDDGTVRVWNVPEPKPDSAQLSTPWLESLTGLRLRDQSGVESLDTQTWTQRRRQHPINVPATPSKGSTQAGNFTSAQRATPR